MVRTLLGDAFPHNYVGLAGLRRGSSSRGRSAMLDDRFVDLPPISGQTAIHLGRKGWVGSRTPISGTASCRGKRLLQVRCILGACMAPSTLPPRRPAFRFRSLPPERARLQRPRQGSVPCSRFSYAQAESAQRVSCRFACRSMPPLYGVKNVCRSPRAVALCPSPIHLPGGRTAGCLCAPHGRSG